MSGLIITTPSSATRPGLYFVAQQPPASVVAIGTGISCMLAQMPWGPTQSIYSPSSIGDWTNTFAPPGMSRLGSGYLSAIQKGWPQLKTIGILGNAIASATIATSGATSLFSVAGKYGGTAGNSITVTIAAASNGSSSYFNMTVSVTGASGTTSDFFPNLTSAAGVVSGYTAAQLSNAIITGTITWIANGNPATGTTSMSGGTNNSITAASYVGTLGTTNQGMALMEGDLTISNFFMDDMGTGSGLRASCNAGAVAHANYMTSQFGHICGPSGNNASAAQTDVLSYQSDYVTYTWPWSYEYDDTTGALQFVQPSCWTASMCAQTSPSTLIAARDPSITQFLSGLQKLEYTAGANAPNNTAAGITTIISNPKGGFTYELDVVTELPQNPSQGQLPTWRMAVYAAASMQQSLQSWVNGPNVGVTQDSLNTAVSNFMDNLQNNQNNDPLHTPYILAWTFGNFASYNTTVSLDAGNYFIPILFQTDAGMQKIFVAAQFGPTVNIAVSANASS